jgi:hypothetical protein
MLQKKSYKVIGLVFIDTRKTMSSFARRISAVQDEKESLVMKQLGKYICGHIKFKFIQLGFILVY